MDSIRSIPQTQASHPVRHTQGPQETKGVQGAQAADRVGGVSQTQSVQPANDSKPTSTDDKVQLSDEIKAELAAQQVGQASQAQGASAINSTQAVEGVKGVNASNDSSRVNASSAASSVNAVGATDGARNADAPRPVQDIPQQGANEAKSAGDQSFSAMISQMTRNYGPPQTAAA